MKILYIDTTTNHLYAALWDKEKITGEINLQLDKDLSVFTLQKMKEMLEKQNIILQEIDKIIVVNGPGSFTGIRIGVTIAKTIAYCLKKEISTVTSLEAMALSSRVESDYKVPIIDARRGYIYAGIFDQENHPILKQQYMSLTALKCMIENLPGTVSVITNNDLDIEKKEPYIPNFEKIIFMNKDKESINPHAVNPTYFKLTEAEEKQNLDLI